MDYILASASPQRAKLLKKVVYNYDIIEPQVDEIDDAKHFPQTVAMLNAKAKALNVFDKCNAMGRVATVIGCDTVVCLNNKIIGKPKDQHHAYEILKGLSGNTHTVTSGFYIINNNGNFMGYDTSTVRFKELTDQQIMEYIEKNKPYGYAGSYAIQDDAGFVESYQGSYDNIVGLPTEKLLEALRNF